MSDFSDVVSFVVSGVDVVRSDGIIGRRGAHTEEVGLQKRKIRKGERKGRHARVQWHLTPPARRRHRGRRDRRRRHRGRFSTMQKGKSYVQEEERVRQLERGGEEQR